MPTDLGEVMVALARKEIGRGETEGNNQGEDIDKYRSALGKGIGGTGSWCGALVSWLILNGAMMLGRSECPVKLSHGARALFRQVVAAGQLVPYEDVQPGDIVLFDRGDPKRKSERWKAHIGLVSLVTRHNGKVTAISYIAGNEGKYPAKVWEYPLTKHKARRLVGFARMG